MHITDFQIIPYKVRLKTPWQTAHSQLLFRQGFLVKLIINDSLSAIGECAPMEAIGTESLIEAQLFLEKKLPEMLGQTAIIDSLDDTDLHPACRFALETAILSLQAQEKKQSIASLLNPEFSKKINVNTILGQLNKNIISNARQAEVEGFKCLKIKLGSGSIKTEAHILEELIKHIEPSTTIRLDANKSWSVTETQWLLNFLKPYKNEIDNIEEPLKHFASSDYKALQEHTDISLALDESFCSLKFTQAPEQYPVNTLVLKPMAQGGILNTLRLARLAERAKIKTVITSSIETAYGLWPIAHLCAAINNGQFHGIATANWLEDTLTEPPGINHGIITL